MKLTAILLIALALTGGGCASLSPSASRAPTWQQSEQKNGLVRTDAPPDKEGLWKLVYFVTCIGGQALASR